MTAEKVKSKLQSLLTASNAKTGKSDANLTDAVKTLLEGYGSGGGGGECSGNHIIEVDELPTENIDETALYKIGENYYKRSSDGGDIIVVMDGIAQSFSKLAVQQGMTYSVNIIPTKTTENIQASENTLFHFYYIEDENVVCIYYHNTWMAADLVLGISFKGVVANINQATEEGYYVTFGSWQEYVKYVAQPPLGTITEIATEAEMNELLSTNRNCLYRYVGMSTETYKQGEFYLITQDLDQNKMFRKIIPTESEGLSYTLLDDGTYMVAMGDCNDAYVVIPPYHNGIAVTAIADEAFRYEWYLEGVVIPDTVTRIGTYAFGSTTIALRYLAIPNSVNYIGNSAFSNAQQLKGVVIPEGVTEILEFTFDSCLNLKYVIIPKTVTSIGNYAFTGCIELDDIYFNGTVAQWNAITKVDTWNDNVHTTKVICSDGEVAL